MIMGEILQLAEIAIMTCQWLEIEHSTLTIIHPKRLQTGRAEP